MTIYEQIQRALDQMEADLASPGGQASAAREAGMSVRSFQHWFWAVTGQSYKEYLVGRRLSEAARTLAATDRTVLEVALESGYRTHESFTRAFRDRFGRPPAAYRKTRPDLPLTVPIRIYKELAMGVIIKELPALRALVFDGFGPGPEDAAHQKLDAWRKAHPASGAPGRVFGHNLTAEGTMAFGPDYAGYRLLLTLPGAAGTPDPDGSVPVADLAPGRFAVTGIEGNFAGDPQGRWISAGWARMNRMIGEKGYRVKEGGRWFEEELEPQTPGNLRLDLYLELVPAREGEPR